MKSKKRNFSLHDLNTAPEASCAYLERTQKAFGMIPNLERAMSESPVLLSGYTGLWSSFAGSSLSAIEQHVVMQTINVYHACDY